MSDTCGANVSLESIVTPRSLIVPTCSSSVPAIKYLVSTGTRLRVIVNYLYFEGFSVSPPADSDPSAAIVSVEICPLIVEGSASTDKRLTAHRQADSGCCCCCELGRVASGLKRPTSFLRYVLVVLRPPSTRCARKSRLIA